MSKYVIEISDEDLVLGCKDCPMNYDFQHCVVYHGDWSEEPVSNSSFEGCKEGRPKNCPLTKVKTTTRDGKHKTKYGRWIPLCEVCGYAIGDDRYNFCPKCGAEIVQELGIEVDE